VEFYGDRCKSIVLNTIINISMNPEDFINKEDNYIDNYIKQVLEMEMQ